jgi:hypothetical protein
VCFETFVAVLNNICEYVGAPLIVLVFYWFRFHTLKGTRSYTKLVLYCVGVAMFVLPFLLIYLSIYYLFNLDLLEGKTVVHAPSAACVVENTPIYALSAVGIVENAPIHALSAVCLVMLVWLIPGPPRWWRDFCQSMARIPFCAFGIRSTLMTSAWEMRPEDLPYIASKLARIGFPAADLRATQSAPIQSRFLKITTIMHHLEDWKLEGNRFLNRNSEHYSDMLGVYDLLSFKAIRALKNNAAIYSAIMENSGVQPDDWHALDSLSAQNDSSNRLQSAAQNAAGGMLEDLRKDMDFLLEHLLLLITRCALASEWSFAGRKRRLEAVGFTVTPPSSAILRMALAGIGISAATVLAWFVTIKNPASFISGIPEVGVTRTFVMSPLNIIVSFLIVYHLKRSYAFANEGVFGGLPIKFILSIGILTALLLFPIQAAFDYYQFRGEKYRDWNYMEITVHGLPVLLYMWATGSVTALLVQDSMWSSFGSEQAKRIMDGIVFGTAMTLVVGLLFAINKVFPIPVMENMAQASYFEIVVFILGFSFVAGFVLGFCLITFIRRAGSLRFSRQEMISNEARAYV